MIKGIWINTWKLCGETFGTNGTPPDCVHRIISEGLGVEMDEEFKIERVHRQMALMSNMDQPPRPVLIHFQLARNKVTGAAKEKRRFEWGKYLCFLTCRMSWQIRGKLSHR